VIRFSAALVAVAIGVLIGGIATSKLLLVYLAIVVSAVALVALAIGVVLKREELFGESQGLVPVGAGTGPVPTSRVSASQGDGVAANTVPVGAVPLSTGPASAHVPPPPPYAGAGGAYGPGSGGTGFAGTAQPAPAAAVPSVPAASAASSQARSPAPGQGEQGRQGRSAASAPPWETPAARERWQSPAADWMPAGQSEREVGVTGGAGGRTPTAWPDTTQGGTSGGRAAGWGSPPAKSGAGSGSSSAGSGSGAPSWFERLGTQASAADTAAVDAGFTDTGSAGTGSGGEDDDWPTRYSWLEDDADDSGEAGGAAPKTVAVNVADMDLGRTPPPPAVTDDAGEGDGSPGATPDADGDPEDEAEEPGGAVIAFRRPEGSTGHSPVGDEDEDHSPAAETGADGEADAPGEAETGDEPSATSERSATEEVAPDPEATLVTVVPGVPRYHKTDCVLIRFMPDEDVRQIHPAEAKDAGCTPCAACQPAK